MTVLARLRVLSRFEFGLKAAVEPFKVSNLLERMPERLLVHHRQVNRVTVAAHSRILNIGVVFRIDSKRLLHRVRGDLLVFERAIHLVALADSELAGYPMLEEKLQRILPRRRLVFDYVMTSGAAHTVASERAVLEILIHQLGVVDKIQTEVRFGTLWIGCRRIVVVVGVELAFAHHSVTTTAGIDDCLLIVLSVFLVSQLTVLMRVEY